MNSLFLAISHCDDCVVLLGLGLELQELLLLLVVVPRADTCDNQDTEEDGEALNPSYIFNRLAKVP